jgi:hypothetical protein
MAVMSILHRLSLGFVASTVGLSAFVGCSTDPPTPQPTVPLDEPAQIEPRVKQTLEDLAALGSKVAGTPGGVASGEYVKKRFDDLGLADVHFEPFTFLSYSVASSSIQVTAGVDSLTMDHKVLHQSGAGHVDADIVDVGNGHEEDYVGKDVAGKIVLVERDPAFHRQSQYTLIAAHGGAAMLYISKAPSNLIQVGTAADPEDGVNVIPAISIGVDDGAQIRTRIEQGATAHAVIDVDASTKLATGRNVVGTLPGTDPTGAYIVVGAHYDAWFTGSTDNGTGVAALIDMAKIIAARPARRLGVVFVGYDGEELGLFGGYDYLRKHVIVGNEPMLAFLNLEQPGGYTGGGLRALAHTNGGPIEEAGKDVELNTVYNLYVGMQVIPALAGGFIPTDIQGMYWSGIQGATTVCDSPYYHTEADTPEKVDQAFLSEGVSHLVKLLDVLDESPIASFDKLDDQVWNPDVKTTKGPTGDIVVDVTAKDSMGLVQAAANVRVWLDVDDFSRVFDKRVVADASGKTSVTVPASALAEGAGGRWIHVTAGEKYPLSERITLVP